MEVSAQSIAGISPTSTLVLVISLVFASAGNGTWLAYLLATIGLMLVGLGINQFAKRSASPGAFFVYIGQALGPSVGFISGWSLLLAYILSSVAALIGASNFASVLLAMMHITVHPLILYAVGAALIWYVAYKDIRLSASLMLVLEGVSIVLILILGILVLVNRSNLFDWPQIQLSGINFDGVRLGLILAIFSYVGYESATAIGEEAKRPLVTVPRAVLLSPLICGIFFMAYAYIEILGFRTLSVPFDKSTAPINDLADSIGLPFIGVLIVFGAVVSLFACALASVNASARIMFRMGGYGVLPKKLGAAHQQNQTPHYATTLTAVLMFFISAVSVCIGISVLDAISAMATMATFGFLLVYILISVAAPVYLRSLRELRAGHILVAIVSILFLLLPAIATFYPLPAAPADKLPIYFGAYMLVGIVWLVWFRLTSPAVVERIRQDLKFGQAVASSGDVEAGV